MKDYGKELILDVHYCSPTVFTRKSIRKFIKNLCVLIDMQPEKLVWWDDLHTLIKDRETEPHLVGTSVVQFIRTSNITIHTLDILRRVYFNIFSCKDFDENLVSSAVERWSKGRIVNKQVIPRR